MNAAVYSTYGPPEVVSIQERDRPAPANHEVLIRIEAAAVSATDAIFRRGRPYVARLGCGLLKPTYPTLGDVLCGEVIATGAGVSRYQVGDRVYGSSGPQFGAHAEYICLPEDGALALKPEHLSSAEAVSLADGGLTALPFLREEARIRRGQRVLVNGASGSIGSIAVQVAKYLGAHVTGVCSGANIVLVESLGAEHVIDYTKDDFTAIGKTWDIIFDTVGKRSFTACKKALSPNGIYLTTVLNAIILFDMLRTAKLGSRRATIAFAGLRPPEKKAEDLAFLNERVQDGSVKGIVDRCFPLEDIVNAHRHVDTGHKKGSIVVQMGPIGSAGGPPA